MAKHDDGLDALRYAFEALGRKSAQDTREQLIRKLEQAQDYADFNGGTVEDMKSVAEAFRGCEISDRELSSIIAAGIRSWKDDRIMAQCIEFRCGICGKQCAYRFNISEEEIACSAINHVEMHKRQMFRQMGYKFSEHCPYSLK